MSEHRLALKHRDVEESIDLWFYRPLGAWLARALARTQVTPNMVTLASGLIGVLCGHLFVYQDLRLTLLGILAYIVANLLDSVDGQLARMKGMTTRTGRILDGVAGAAFFLSIYGHVAYRLVAEGWGAWAWLLGTLAFISQVVQNSMSDYYRQAYLACAFPSPAGYLEPLDEARRLYREAEGGPFFQRLLLRFYRDYVWRQERLAPHTSRLVLTTRAIPAGDSLRDASAWRYRELNRPLIPHLAWLATNLRMLILFALLLVRQHAWFFAVAILPLNLVLVAVVRSHERNSLRVTREINSVLEDRAHAVARDE